MFPDSRSHAFKSDAVSKHACNARVFSELMTFEVFKTHFEVFVFTGSCFSFVKMEKTQISRNCNER